MLGYDFPIVEANNRNVLRDLDVAIPERINHTTRDLVVSAKYAIRGRGVPRPEVFDCFMAPCLGPFPKQGRLALTTNAVIGA
ncbi:hypothetical protein D3C87_2007030 [compost metagenome]